MIEDDDLCKDQRIEGLEIYIDHLISANNKLKKENEDLKKALSK